MFIFNNFWVLTFFATLTFILSVSAETCKPQINRVFDLRKTLFCNYDTSLIAKRDKNKNATKINVGFTFNYFDFNQWDNTVTIAHWLVLRWTDDHLTWNPDLFDGIKEINVNVDELWMPDLTIYNPSGMYNSEITHPSINCDLQHTGFIVCVIPNSYYTLCKSNHLNFPYDEHECTLRFGSLLYTKKNVEFKIPKMQGYLGTLNNKNLEWKVINATGKIKERHIDLNDTMQEIAYTFRFARHATVLEATLIVPMLVLIVFTILPFFLSPIENERFTLIIFNIFAHITIFYQIPWTIPHSGDTTPLIVSFYRDSLIISILVLFESAIVCWFDKKSTQIPDSLAPLFQIILQHKNWILLTVPGEKHVESEEESENVTSNGVDESDLKTESLDGPIHVTIPIKPSSGAQDWHILRLFLDRLFICIILFLYIILFITHVPSHFLIIFKNGCWGYMHECDKKSEPETGYKSFIRKLGQKLMCNYDYSEKPGEKEETVIINATMLVNSLDVYFQKEIKPQISVHNRLYLEWFDKRLEWDPKDFDGIDILPVHTSNIWAPEISLANGLNSDDHSVLYSSVCRLTYSGKVQCLYPNTFTSLCVPAYENWPLNTEVCELLIGAWIMHSDAEHIRFRFIERGSDFSQYHPHNEWDLESVSSSFLPESEYYDANETYHLKGMPYLDYIFTLRHHSAMFATLIIAPVIVLITMNLVGVLLDPSSLKRIALIMANILIHIEYLKEISYHTNASGTSCPLIVIFYRSSMILSVINLIVTLIIMKLFKANMSDPTGVSNMFKFIVDNEIVNLITLDEIEIKDNKSYNQNKEIINKNTQTWIQLGKLLNVLLFWTLFVAYIVLVIRFVPSTSYSKPSQKLFNYYGSD
ncbi:uncharacterized protein LOC123292814 [Chrysoperla carnea]|uniref:uncharacterized protein LOC123292814 n=1 Tax=Chrysoperla carnea TaxID=189513 RepID=UPI001D096B91|nr:uncharacterized protein LOC123292814 [Chrysoperla carnea]